jgi:transcriptional regulator with XRE-family HTH domain
VPAACSVGSGQQVVSRLVQAMTDFGGELRRLIAERGLSLNETARRVPCNRGYLSKVTRGLSRPSAELCARLDEVLDAGGALIEASGSRQTRDPAARRLQSLSPAQAEELLNHLQDQWHALVKTDNLLGPKYALSAVTDHLEVIGMVLRAARQAVRTRALSLGARYAESAAWLYEDSGDLEAGRWWVGRCMEWAVEAGDDVMVAWSLFRRSCQAVVDGDAAQVIGLANAARRGAGSLPHPMLAAIFQQEAQGHALDGATAGFEHALEHARSYAAAGDPGDASSGHGSFCTPAYLDMQAGRCWLRLGRPAKALSSLQAAVDMLPVVYQRDRGVALSGLAAAFAATGEAEQAARAALRALAVARDTGSWRVLAMTRSAASGLPRRNSPPEVAELREALAATAAV